MRSHNPYNLHLRRAVPRREEKLITTLVNSGLYFLENVFIVKEAKRYRLIVCHRKEVLADQDYESLRGAKIAFSKLFQEQAHPVDAKPEWSHLYPPEKKWLEAKLRICLEPFARTRPLVAAPLVMRDML
jgi:hypothetical protein